MTKYIFITGGVVSSLGKGIASASLGAILEARQINVSFIKLDPYLNVDPGTMNPSQHGEVFVTADGAETDLDLGHYERFVNITLSKKNNFTAGRIYANVLQKERQGVYLGGTVQVIPHVTDEIKQSIQQADPQVDVMIVEIGGTVGDIESLPFLEAIRQMRIELGVSETLFIHLGLVPYIKTAGEIKTKPVQHSVRELRTIGIQPDIIICRSEQPLPKGAEEKIALFTNVEKRGIISLPDKTSIYEIPVLLHAQGLDKLVLNKLKLPEKQANLSCWLNVLQAENTPTQVVDIAIIGKYTGMADCYKSLNEALKHAGIKTKTRLNMHYIDAEHIEKNGTDTLKQVRGIIVPGGFGQRGTEGKIIACRHARENRIPYVGICLGMQIAVIEFARHVAQLANANSTEFDPSTPYPVICLIDATGNMTDIGGTMRLGNQVCYLEKDSLAEKIYGKQQIQERHRHRYEVNPIFLPVLMQSGMSITGRSANNGRGLVELIEFSEHPFFMACQFHPEFISTPRNAHPLFEHFVRSMIAQ